MPMSNGGLTKLIEECSELNVIAAKKIAYPDVERHPDGQHLNKRLEEEIGDVIAAIDFVAQKFNLNLATIHNRREMKLATYNRWDTE